MNKSQLIANLTSIATGYLTSLGGAQYAKAVFVEAIKDKKPDTVASAIAKAINADTSGLKAARSERRKALLKAVNETFDKQALFAFTYNKKQESYVCHWQAYVEPTETEEQAEQAEQLAPLPEAIELEISDEIIAQPVPWADEAHATIQGLLATAPADANKTAIKSLKAALTALSK